jgi:hypothetical protein
LAGMLPPFVPPSVRAQSEILPLITEFVVQLTEQSFDTPAGVYGEDSGAASAVATLPSIDEFVKAPAAQEKPTDSQSDDDFVQRTSRSPWGTYEAKHEIAGGGTSPEVMPASVSLEPDMLLTEHHAPSGSQDAVVNEIVEPADAWAASAAGGHAQEAQAASEPTADAETDRGSSAPSQNSPEGWVAEERDAFDWHSVASLAVPPAEEQRAAEEWSSTEWERSSGSIQDHVSTLLAQVARRVRSGELEVQGSKQMGADAALVAVLGALLAESAKKKS